MCCFGFVFLAFSACILLAYCCSIFTSLCVFRLCAGGGKSLTGYQKTSAEHTYGAGSLNIAAATEVPKVKENLGYAKSDGAGTSSYGHGAVGIETATNAPKIKHEGLGAVDKKKEQVYQQ